MEKIRSELKALSQNNTDSIGEAIAVVLEYLSDN